MKDNTKNALIIAAVVLILAVVIAVVVKKDKSGQSGNNSTDTVGMNNQGQDGINETPADEVPEGSTAPSARSLTYSEALKIYGSSGNGFRYQFAANCLASPQKLSMKKGTKFMIDNRDSVAHTVVIGTQSFRLARFGFAIVTSKDVGDFPVKCDGVNRSQILVGK